MPRRFLALMLVPLATLVPAAEGCGGEPPRARFEPLDAALPIGPSFGADAGSEQDASDDAICAGAVVTLARSPVYMLVIMDGSASMLEPLVEGGPPGLKWQAAREAMLTFIDKAAQAKDASFGLGLFLFDGTKGVSEFETHDVAIDYVDAAHASALEQRILGSTPAGGTPLKRAIQGQTGVLASFLPYTPLKKNGKRVLVVMTDGVPDGATSVLPQEKQACVDLVSAARQGSAAITTFAVGVGSPSSPVSVYDEQFLGSLAVAGGAAPPGCNPAWSEASPPSEAPCHFQVTPGQKSASQLQAELLAAIDAIRGAATSCEYELVRTDGSPGVPDPSKVNVLFTDGSGETKPIAKDPVNGWSFDNPSSPSMLRLSGDACLRVRSETSGKLSVELGCTTRVD